MYCHVKIMFLFQIIPEISCKCFSNALYFLKISFFRHLAYIQSYIPWPFINECWTCTLYIGLCFAVSQSARRGFSFSLSGDTGISAGCLMFCADNGFLCPPLKSRGWWNFEIIISHCA